MPSYTCTVLFPNRDGLLSTLRFERDLKDGLSQAGLGWVGPIRIIIRRACRSVDVSIGVVSGDVDSIVRRFCGALLHVRWTVLSHCSTAKDSQQHQ